MAKELTPKETVQEAQEAQEPVQAVLPVSQAPRSLWRRLDDSTEALPIPGLGSLVRTKVMAGSQLAVAVAVVPDAYVSEVQDKDGNFVGFKLGRAR